MSSVQQLQLSGIRSFDPNPANKQSIYFQKPLTVILGKNGAGKTTIIESLLHACSGAMPPGSGQEKSSFIYDPKIIGESEVKGQIRLIFTGKSGQNIQVIRSFQVVRMRQKTSFATLDNTIAYQDMKTGKVSSSTYKASDVDRVMPDLLGVSPAVLEHVVFCHQEASNWPLSSPKEVKQIFDEIFAATRYVLALEQFREIGREYRGRLKNQEAHCIAVDERRKYAQDLLEKLQRKSAAVRDIEKCSTDLRPQLEKLEAVLALLDERDQQMEQLSHEASLLEGKVLEKREALARQASDISVSNKDTAAALTVDQIEVMIRQSQERAEAARGQKQELRAGSEHLDDQLREAKLHVDQLGFRVQNLERKAFEHQQYCTNLKEKIGPAATNDVFSDLFVLRTDKAEELVRRAHHTLKEAQEQMLKQRQLAEELIGEGERRVNTILRRMDADSKECDMIEASLPELRNRLQNEEEEVRSLQQRWTPERLKELKEEVVAAEQQVRAAEDLRLQRKPTDLRTLTVEYETEVRRAADLRQRMSRMSSNGHLLDDIKKLQERLRERQADEQSQMETMKLHIEKVQLREPLPGNFFSLHAAVRVHHERRREDLSVVIQKTDEAANQLRFLDTQRENVLESLQQCRSDYAAICRTLGKEMDTISGEEAVEHYEEIVDKARREAESREHELHKLTAMSFWMTDLLTAAAEKDGCPLCERDFDNDVTLQMFLNRNESRKTSESALNALSADVQKSRAKLDHVQRMQRAVTEARQHAIHIQQLLQSDSKNEKEWEAQKNKLQELKNLCKEKEEECSAVQVLLTRLDACLPIAQEIEFIKAELATTTKEKEVVERQIEEAGGRHLVQGPTTMEELMDQYESSMTRQQMLQAQLTALKEASKGVEESIATASNILAVKRAGLSRAEEDVKRQSSLEKRVMELQQQIRDRKSRGQELVQQRSQLQAELSEVQKKVKEMRRQRTAEEDELNKKILSLQQHASSIKPLVERALDFQLDDGPGRIRREQEILQSKKEEVSQLCAAKEEMRRQLTQLEDTEQRLHRELADLQWWAAFKKGEQALQADEERLQVVYNEQRTLKEKKLMGVDDLLGPDCYSLHVSQLREKVRQKIRSLEMSTAQKEGNIETLLQDVQQLRQELSSDKYQSIEKHYRAATIQVHTTKTAIKDIDKFYVALEKAVQSYHQEKITQINQIIADLWRQTYRGSDIDAVEIRSETENTSIATGRRSYNYRVVMRRGSTEIDMRGRCSAGQKVLASIVIRLALSEVFCYDCGILALDEPTTNLDEDNARSLAEALRLLIESRRTVRHFQLIVITHDEQFVRALGGGQALDRFYFVHKDREGAYSVIEERTFAQLFA